jgi:hypothetical protein
MKNHINHPIPCSWTNALAINWSNRALIQMTRIITWFRRYNQVLLLVGVIPAILTMFQWWRNIIQEGTYQGLCLSVWLYTPLDLGRFFSFLILHTVCRTSWTGDKAIARPLPTHRTTQTQNKRKKSSMPRVGFEFTTPVFERAKTVH